MEFLGNFTFPEMLRCMAITENWKIWIILKTDFGRTLQSQRKSKNLTHCHFVFWHINFGLNLQPGNSRWKSMKKTKKITYYLRFQQIPLFLLSLEYPGSYPWNPGVPIFQGRTLWATKERTGLINGLLLMWSFFK